MKYTFSLLLIFFSSTLFSQSLSRIPVSDSLDNFYEIRDEAKAWLKQNGGKNAMEYKHFKRWEMMMEPRVYPDGKLFNIAEKSLDGYHDYIKSDDYQNLPTAKSNSGGWESIGPSGWSATGTSSPGNGRINTLITHPGNTSILYAGAASGGVWKSVNSGSSWFPLTDGMPNLGVSGIAINPNNTNEMYILTGDGDGGDLATMGVLKTVNGGITWVQTGTLDANPVPSEDNKLTGALSGGTRGYKLLMHPTNPQVLFAATTTGLYRTNNAGMEWELIYEGSTSDIAFKPGDSEIMYAATRFGTGFLRSTDGGESFNTVFSSLSSLGDDYSRAVIGVSPNNPEYVYVLYGGGSTGFPGLFRSTNSGETFTLRSDSPNIFGGAQDGSGTRHQAFYDIAIAVDPQNVNRVIMGGINIWKSENGGASWSVESNQSYSSAAAGKYVHADIHWLSYVGNTLWIACDGGVFRSFDDAESFTNRSNGLVITQYYRMCTSGTSALGGTQDNGTLQLNEGSSEALQVFGADGFECFFTHGTGDFYASTQNGHFRRNLFQQWTNITPPPVAADTVEGPWNVDWLMAPGSNSTIFLGTHLGTIARSANKGLTWTYSPNVFSYDNRVYNVEMSPSNINRLYAASGTSVRRSDNCNDASPIYNNITDPDFGYITGLKVSPSNSNQVYLTCSGYNTDPKVFMSTNAGASWTNIGEGLPPVPVNCVEYDSESNSIYVGTDIGVFYRPSGGGWLPFSNGLPTVIVTELEINQGELYAATFGRGMWKSSLYQTCPLFLTLTDFNDPSPSANSTGFQYYNASFSVNSSRTISGGIGTDVTYRGGLIVDLTEGFHAMEDNLFLAEIGPCDPSLQELTPLEPFEEGVLEIAASAAQTSETLHLSFDQNERLVNRVYPNPFTDLVTVELAAFEGKRNATVRLFDLTGKELQLSLKVEVPAGQRLTLPLDLPNLPKGIYFLSIEDDHISETHKVIKQ